MLSTKNYVHNKKTYDQNKNCFTNRIRFVIIQSMERGKEQEMELTGRIFNIQKFSINDGPGIRTTVFFKGCPLQCKWCSNPESQNRFASVTEKMDEAAYCGRIYTVEEVMQVVRQDKPFYDHSGGGVTFSGGDVLQQAEFASVLADAAHAEGIHVAAETEGYTAPERFRDFLTHVDLLLYDFKHADREIHFWGTGVYNDVIVENLRYAVMTEKDVIARIPVIPRFNASLSAAEMIAGKLSEIGVKEVHLLPFHQLGESKYEKLGIPYEMKGVPQLHPENLEKYREVFLQYGLACTFK